MRAAARVRAGESSHRKRGTTLQNDTTRGGTNSSARGGRVASKVQTTKRVTVPDGRGGNMETRSIVEGEDSISKAVGVTREEKQSEEKCGTSKTLNNRVLLFRYTCFPYRAVVGLAGKSSRVLGVMRDGLFSSCSIFLALAMAEGSVRRPF